jgi:hypothetical protein
MCSILEKINFLFAMTDGEKSRVPLGKDGVFEDISYFITNYKIDCFQRQIKIESFKIEIIQTIWWVGYLFTKHINICVLPQPFYRLLF